METEIGIGTETEVVIVKGVGTTILHPTFPLPLILRTTHPTHTHTLPLRCMHHMACMVDALPPLLLLLMLVVVGTATLLLPPNNNPSSLCPCSMAVYHRHLVPLLLLLVVVVEVHPDCLLLLLMLALLPLNNHQ